MTRHLWILLATCTGIYSVSRIILGITYAFIPKAHLPPALQDWTSFPIQVWGALWAFAGVAGLGTSVLLYRRFSFTALASLVGMNVAWTTAYFVSWLKGENTDAVASSTYAGTWALVAGFGVAIAILRRRAREL